LKGIQSPVPAFSIVSMKPAEELVHGR